MTTSYNWNKHSIFNEIFYLVCVEQFSTEYLNGLSLVKCGVDLGRAYAIKNSCRDLTLIQ